MLNHRLTAIEGPADLAGEPRENVDFGENASLRVWSDR